MSPIPGARPPESALPVEAGQPTAQPNELPRKESFGNTKIAKSNTETTAPDTPIQKSTPKRLGRPPRTTTPPSTWSVRGVSREARRVLEQGAARAGKTLGQYLSEDVQALVADQLRRTAPVEANLQAEIQYLRQLVENLTVMVSGTENFPPASSLPERPAPRKAAARRPKK